MWSASGKQSRQTAPNIWFVYGHDIEITGTINGLPASPEAIEVLTI